MQADELTAGMVAIDGVAMPRIDKLYKLATVADMLDCSVHTLARYRREGKLRVVGTTVGLRIKHSDLVAFANVRYGG